MKIKKIFILLAIMVMMASSLILPNTSMAVENKQILTIKKGTDYGSVIREDNAVLKFVRTYYEGNGGIHQVYCIDKTKPGVAEVGQDYNVVVGDKITDERLWRIIKNSYPNVTWQDMGCDSPAQAFIATKLAVYIILENKDINQFSAVIEEGNTILSAVKALLRHANDETELPYSSEIKIQTKGEWKLEKYNGNVYLANTFSAENTRIIGRYTVALRGYIPNGTLILDQNNRIKNQFYKGNNFKVLIPSEKVNKENTLAIEAKAEVTTLPIYIGIPENSEYQSYLITGIRNEIGKGEANVKYSCIGGELIITKKDLNTNEKLQGAVFNIYDQDKKLIYSNMETDADGQIKIYNLLQGKYLVEEVKAPEGYKVLDKMVEINVEENTNVNLIINNSKPITTKKEENNVTIEIVENSTENNTTIKNDHYKDEINNTTNNTTIINNNYENKINNNENNNYIENNNTIINTNNNSTTNSNNNLNNNLQTNNKTEISNSNQVKKLPKTGM